jgi:hypothetical protein
MNCQSVGAKDIYRNIVSFLSLPQFVTQEIKVSKFIFI